MKSRFGIWFVCAIIIGLLVTRVSGQQTLGLGVPANSFTDADSGTTTGTSFALPAQAIQCTWVTSYGTGPASITILLETSLDNSVWSTLDTSTAVAGETRNVNTSAVFIRARISAISMGDNITVALTCKAGFIPAGSPTLTSLTVTDITITGTCTGCIAAGASPTFTQVTTPLIYGGTATTADLVLNATSGIAASGASVSIKAGTQNPMLLANYNGTSGVIQFNRSAGASGYFEIEVPRIDVTAGNTINVYDSTAQAIGVGGGISFVGHYTDAGAYTPFAAITSYKSNGTTTNYSGDLGFYVRTTGSGGWTAKTSALMWMDGVNQRVGIGNQAPATKLDVTGAISNAGALMYSNAVPTITSGFSTSTPSIAGKASAFAVTIGTPTIGSTTGLVAFNTTFTNVPSCTATNTITANAVQAVPTATTVVLNGVWVASDIIRVICIGY